MHVIDNDKLHNISRYEDFEKNQKEYIFEKWKIWKILITQIITYTLRKSIENNFWSEKIVSRGECQQQVPLNLSQTDKLFAK